MQRTVTIDAFPESVYRYQDGYTIVAVDVIRATTTAVTAVATGRRCYPVATLDDAFLLADRIPNSILAGELGGIVPDGFEMNNSPAAFDRCADTERPVILLSTSGTQLICQGLPYAQVYVACFRNARATVEALQQFSHPIVVIGAGSKNEFREEDQMCCAWIAAGLMDTGFKASNSYTESIVNKWKGKPPAACAQGNSAAYLRRSNQLDDLDFVLSHINDLPFACVMRQNELVPVHQVAAETYSIPPSVMEKAMHGFQP